MPGRKSNTTASSPPWAASGAGSTRIIRDLAKENGGKPSALNAGLRAASHEIVVMVDGDTVFQRDTIGKLVGQLADPAVGAVFVLLG